jgi:hypothetical protein
MRAKEFIFEYRRDKTAQSFGAKMYQHYTTGPDSRMFNLNTKAFSNMNGEVEPEKVLNFVFSEIEAADPSKAKIFTPWLAREYAKGNIQRLEDIPAKLTPFLGDYEVYKRKKDFPTEYKDLMRLTAPQFYQFMTEFEPPEDEQVDKGLAEEIYRDSSVRVIHPKDQTAACYYGQGTQWCTASTRGSNYFDHYNRQGSMYILLPTQPKYEGEKYQLHFSSSQFMDETDEQVDLLNLLRVRFPALEDLFKKIEPAMQDMILFAPDELISSLVEKIADYVREAAWDSIMEWQHNDDYFDQWRSEQAIERGYVDEEGEVDWDKVHEDDELNNYLKYNYEAERWQDRIEKAISVTPREIRSFLESAIEGGDAEGDDLNLEKLEKVIAGLVEKYTRGEAEYIVDFINEKIYVQKTGGQWEVKRVFK